MDPFVLTFPNGRPSRVQSASVRVFADEGPSGGLSKKKKKKKKKKKSKAASGGGLPADGERPVVVAQVPGTTQLWRGEGIKRDLPYKFVVASYNRTNHAVEYCEASEMFAVRLWQDPTPETTADAGADGEAWKNRQRDLTAAFGARKQKAYLEKMEANRVSSDRLADAGGVHAALSMALAQQAAAAPTEDQIARGAAEAMGLPEHDLNADNPADAYPIEGIIPDWVVGTMEADLKALNKATKKQKFMNEVVDVHPAFVVSRIKDTLTGLAGDRRPYLHALLTLSLLVRFHTALRGTGKRQRKWSVKEMAEALQGCGEEPLDSAATAAVLDQFLLRSGRFWTEPSPREMQKLVLHVAVAALHCVGFVIAPDHVKALSDDLGLREENMRGYFKEVGCKLPPRRSVKRKRDDGEDGEEAEGEGSGDADAAAATGRNTMRLVAPLSFPPPKNYRRAKKQKKK